MKGGITGFAIGVVKVVFLVAVILVVVNSGSPAKAYAALDNAGDVAGKAVVGTIVFFKSAAGSVQLPDAAPTGAGGGGGGSSN